MEQGNTGLLRQPFRTDGIVVLTERNVGEVMLIQISENRWLSEPEAVTRRGATRTMNNDGADTSPNPPVPEDHTWVARMPSGAMEWLTDEDYGALKAGIRCINGQIIYESQKAAGMVPAPEPQQGDES